MTLISVSVVLASHLISLANSFIMKIFLISILVISMVCCTNDHEERPSVLVIAVDMLPLSSISCETDSQGLNKRSGFQIFCQESVRFTHAYTTSTMSQAALTSILTSRYPHEHGVWHNGNQFLASQVETVAEAAVKSGYRTLFFSGGPPIWRKSGLSQGFETFDDNISVSYGLYYRPVLDTFDLFLETVRRNAKDLPFFSFITVPDLQFSHFPTRDNFGIQRPKSYQGQLDELDESLYHLIEELKQSDLWNSSYIILTGLTGRPSQDDASDLPGYNLVADNTLISLFIKPPRKKRDLGLQWKIDKNVSLVDLGATLFEIVKSPVPKPPSRTIDVVSLLPSVLKIETDWDESRLIVIESAWAQWHQIGGSRFAVRKNNLLFLYDQDMKSYNTLIDRLELNPLSLKDQYIRENLEQVQLFFEEKGFIRWKPVSEITIDKIVLGALLFNQEGGYDTVIKEIKLLLKQMPWDLDLLNWWSFLALKNKDWNELKSVGELTGRPIWTYVARQNLGEEKINMPMDSCLKLLSRKSTHLSNVDTKECSDRLFIDFVTWVKQETRSMLEGKYQDDFIKAYIDHLVTKDLSLLNLSLNLIWDIPLDSFYPSRTELMLNLPRFKRYRRIVEKRIQKM